MTDLDNISVKARASSDEEDDKIDKNEIINKILFYRWKLCQLLTSIEGYSAELGDKLAPNVYKGKNIKTKKKVVFKIEEIKEKGENNLINESHILIKLYKIERTSKIETIKMDFPFIALVTTYIGPSLRYYMKLCGRKFSLATTLKLSIQILDILQQIHDNGVILIYLKPGNLLMGLGENKDYVYIIDFDFAKFYIKDGEHIKEEKVENIVGNRDFISINVHNYIQPSRRDDIESFVYNLIYFMKGELPWSDIYHTEDIKSKKISTSLDELCDGLPEEFKEILKYARNMKFEERPDYEYIKGLLQKVIEKNNIDINAVKYDWVIKGVESKEKDESTDEEEIKLDDNWNKEEEKEFSVISSENDENINNKKKEKQNLEETENPNEIKEKENTEENEEKNQEINIENNEEKKKGIIEDKNIEKNEEINKKKNEIANGEKNEEKDEKINEDINAKKNEEKNEEKSEEKNEEKKEEKNLEIKEEKKEEGKEEED